MGNLCGALAQLGEHLLCKQGVIGSIPIGSTKLTSRNEDTTFHRKMEIQSKTMGLAHRHFDIVNGFFNRCRAGTLRNMVQGFGFGLWDLDRPVAKLGKKLAE